MGEARTGIGRGSDFGGSSRGAMFSQRGRARRGSHRSCRVARRRPRRAICWRDDRRPLAFRAVSASDRNSYGFGGLTRGREWDGHGGYGGWGAGTLALGLTFGNPYWDSWYPAYGAYGGYGYAGGYWGWGYGDANTGYADYPDYWPPEYVGYWDERPTYAGWGSEYFDDGSYRRPRLWRHYGRSVGSRRAPYHVTVAYDVPANCGGSHYVWDDYVGGYVYRPYTYPC